MSKVTASTEAVNAALAALRQAATPVARTAIEEATATAAEFGSIDRRVREYLTSGQPLMGADVIFTEGSDAAATAGRQVETARLAEHQAFDRTSPRCGRNRPSSAVRPLRFSLWWCCS